MRHTVDFVVGAQYGDEGKGTVASLLADMATTRGQSYEWSGRAGAQQAEHRFIHRSCEFCARILPSACAFRDNILAILGPGHCFRPEMLALEAKHLGISLRDVYVDPQAMWLTVEHAEKNAVVAASRGTTGWGVGAAIAEKVTRDRDTMLMKDAVEILQGPYSKYPHLVPACTILNSLQGPGLVEGSQGALLSLNHGEYPYCTSKDVTVSALVNEMGLNHKCIRKVIGVVRMLPMRVPGPSGGARGEEANYDEIEALTGVRIPEYKRLQGDSGKEERIFDFSMEELEYSMRLNAYDYLVITFADYHHGDNYRVRSLDELHHGTRKLLLMISEVAPLLLVRTGPGEHDNIWFPDQVKELFNHDSE